jgi:RNA polymerase sigma-70 factor (ECF subfamily)
MKSDRQTDDLDLIRQVERKNPHALGQLYDRYGRLVYSIALQAISDSAIAQEITQDVFLRIWNKADTYQPAQGKLITWISRIARNRAIDIYRQQRNKPQAHPIGWAEPDLETVQATEDVEHEVEIAIRQQAIRQLVARLPEDQKQAIGLAFFRGMSHQEISELLNLPLGTVKTRIRLGLLKLRQSMDEG